MQSLLASGKWHEEYLCIIHREHESPILGREYNVCAGISINTLIASRNVFQSVCPNTCLLTARGVS